MLDAFISLAKKDPIGAIALRGDIWVQARLAQRTKISSAEEAISCCMRRGGCDQGCSELAAADQAASGLHTSDRLGP
jgi:hypothetical protein